MKSYSIIFSHPVTGKVVLSDNDNKDHKVFYLTSDNEHVIEVPLTGINNGLWHLVFEWNFDDHLHSIAADISID